MIKLSKTIEKKKNDEGQIFVDLMISIKVKMRKSRVEEEKKNQP